MMLNLELWPRQGVIDWADQVVKAHPHGNVIVVTHSYLTSGSAISTDKEYGATTPQHLYETLISKNTNIKVVLSGHVGSYGSRTDSRSGNPVTSFLQCFHDNHDTPTRLLRIDTKTGTVRGQVYYQKSNRWLTAADKTYSGVKWVNWVRAVLRRAGRARPRGRPASRRVELRVQTSGRANSCGDSDRPARSPAQLVPIRSAARREHAGTGPGCPGSRD